MHGLGAHPAYAWLGKLPDGRLVNWLADDGLLPKHVPNVRVMAFNYESRWHRDPIVTRTTVCANQLLKAVDDQRQKVSSPISRCCCAQRPDSVYVVGMF